MAVDKSIYDPDPAPRNQTRVYEAHPDGVKATINTIDAAGRSSWVLYIADYDSMKYPLVGTASGQGDALVQLDPLLLEGTVTHAGRPIAFARRVISADGQTMTITIRQAEAGGDQRGGVRAGDVTPPAAVRFRNVWRHTAPPVHRHAPRRFRRNSPRRRA